jgi:uncharacterized membrane protein YdjX (TVP38/TMEM64 family)
MKTSQNPGLVKWITISILLIVVIVGISLLLEGQAQVLRFFAWLDGLGGWAGPLFILMDMVVVVLVLPGFVLTLGAGFMFGVLKGSLYVIIGTTLGATIAFIIARHFLGEKTARFVQAHSKLKVMDTVIKKEGLKIVLLTRLVPFFPFKLSNYFFGLTQVSLHHFIIGVLFGIIPITVNNVYIGSLAADLATLGLCNPSRTGIEWALHGIGFIIAAGSFVWITRIARKALADYYREGKVGRPGQPRSD